MRIVLTVTLAVFVAGAIVLTTSIPNLYLMVTREQRALHAAVADACASELTAKMAADPAGVPQVLDTLRQRYALAAISLGPGDRDRMMAALGRTSIDPGKESRYVTGQLLELRFNDPGMERAATILRTATIAGIVGSIAGLALMLLNVMQIVSSSRQSARAERSPSAENTYLLESFETSIRAMKGRESELRQLHSQQKERADELATVSSTLVRNLTTGFMAIDEGGLLLDLNQAARELLHIAPGPSVRGRRLADLVAEGPFVALLQQAIDSHAALQRQEVTGQNEQSEVIGLTTVPLLDEGGRYFGMLALFTDLTPVRRLERRVRDMQSLADLGEMSAGIAHEFRNSLSTVLGYLRLLRKEVEPGTTAADRLINAEREAQLLAESVTSLLSFARPFAVERQRIDVLLLSAEIARRIAGPERQGQLAVRGLPLNVDVDPLLIGRAVENLVRNALEAIAERGASGRVVVESVVAPLPQLRISDNGVGIEPELLGRLFLPFQSNKPDGFGLGLALTRKIVVLHGGSVHLTSQLGQGTTVTIEFGASPAADLDADDVRSVTF
jgi:signal transduction histidine kinase